MCRTGRRCTSQWAPKEGFNGHVLKASNHSSVCDHCNRELSECTISYGCRSCNYDLCDTCYFDQPVQTEEEEDQTYYGTVKSFQTQKGFGFISCPEADAEYGRDVFIHKAQLGDIPLYAEVFAWLKMRRKHLLGACKSSFVHVQGPGWLRFFAALGPHHVVIRESGPPLRLLSLLLHTHFSLPILSLLSPSGDLWNPPAWKHSPRGAGLSENNSLSRVEVLLAG